MSARDRDAAEDAVLAELQLRLEEAQRKWQEDAPRHLTGRQLMQVLDDHLAGIPRTGRASQP